MLSLAWFEEQYMEDHEVIGTVLVHDVVNIQLERKRREHYWTARLAWTLKFLYPFRMLPSSSKKITKVP